MNMFKKYFLLLRPYSKRLMSVQKPTGFDWAKQEELLMEPFDYIQKVPSKHSRVLVQAMNYWLQIPDDKLNGIEEINEVWISWNILFDDIEYNPKFRYGVSAAHQVFGVGLTINAANKALLLVQDKVTELGHPLGPKIFMKRVKEYLHGQGIDIYWRENYICPTPEAHIEMKKYNKNGPYVALPVELMQLFSNDKKDYSGLSINFGIYYELLDDFYNLFHHKNLSKLADVKQDVHITCSDITECKISLPLIHASQFPDVADELAYIFKQRTSDPTMQNRAIALLKKHGSDEYMKNTLKKIEADIRKEIDQLGGNPELTAMMDDLSVHKQELELDLYT